MTTRPRRPIPRVLAIVLAVALVLVLGGHTLMKNALKRVVIQGG